ncbi:PQQ-dependent dehydrogenase, methanol/ethanol family [Qipengyuania sp. ASV99]|uniref:PQQ-dependent dehydrogenase, methanol/ethanol family n=1 Tax=Qipengyuania sp. ASV99 TaxID=3399681 RepID=UPI003A4C7302
MNKTVWAVPLLVLGALGVVACNEAFDADFYSEDGITAAMLTGADADSANWITYGRTYSEQRFSPLDQINTENVGELGLAWFADMDTARGQEATPLAIDGKIYVSTAWSKVKAYDGKTGAPLWDYDPEVPGEYAVKACCGVVNRGLAAWGDSLFLGTLDGRLVSLDRNTGKVNWEVFTVNQDESYTITGAPRVIDGKVIIGNGGAELGVRGYVGAYDAETGKQIWRFYTVPDGNEGGESPQYLQDAAETWNTEVLRSSDAIGAGGTAWDAMAYDPDLDLLYIGVGNGSPWNQAIRSPGKDGAGEGDNLYLSSIVALRPDTGEYVWHYQTTPGETWDYTATQHIMLADMEIGGEMREVLMQAPKNGFFYVIDRATGEFLSGEPYVNVTWASGIDPETGRPIQVPEMRVDRTGLPTLVNPGSGGGHNWHPMAYHPDHNLVYIPTVEAGQMYVPVKEWDPDRKRGWNHGFDYSDGVPSDREIRKQLTPEVGGKLLAWDPVAQEARWSVDHPGGANGGVLATAGNLVFQGTNTGEFRAYNAADGEQLWSFDGQTGIQAAPMTYSIEGVQYVAVLVGWGGGFALVNDGEMAEPGGPMANISRLLVFKLGGELSLPEKPELVRLPLDPPPSRADAATIAAGKAIYGRYCSTCHGFEAVGSSVLPDLRRSGTLADARSWAAIVHDGALKDNGMAGFAGSLTTDEIQAIRAFVIHRANADKAAEAAARQVGRR